MTAAERTGFGKQEEKGRLVKLLESCTTRDYRLGNVLKLGELQSCIRVVCNAGETLAAILVEQEQRSREQREQQLGRSLTSQRLA